MSINFEVKECDEESLKEVVQFFERQWRDFEVKDAVFVRLTLSRDGKTFTEFPKKRQRKNRETFCVVGCFESFSYPSFVQISFTEFTDPLVRRLSGKMVFKHKEQVRFNDTQEKFVFFCACESWTWLRRYKLEPGRKSRNHANRYGIKMLEAFRTWRAQPVRLLCKPEEIAPRLRAYSVAQKLMEDYTVKGE